MQRLVLAVLLLAVLAGVVAVLASGLRAAVRARSEAAGDEPSEGATVQKLAYAALLLLILGTSTGVLGGL